VTDIGGLKRYRVLKDRLLIIGTKWGEGGRKPKTLTSSFLISVLQAILLG